MYITAITHASARDKEHNFRSLTAAGQVESATAGRQYASLANGRDVPPIDQIVSSPKPRCLETVILLAKALSNDVLEASSIDVDQGLAAGEIEGGELAALATDADANHVLVSGHADLVKVLPAGASLTADAADGGWFSVRPVLFQVEVEPARSWDQATVHFCTALVDDRWQQLLA